MKKFILIALSLFTLLLSIFSCKKSSDKTPTTPNSTTPASGTFKDLYDFNTTNGETPVGALILSGSTLYGMASAGGANGFGNIFSININGAGFTDLHDFAGSPSDGETPSSNLTLVGTTLYGMTHEGGSGQEGVLFSIGTNGGGFKVLYNFGITDTGGVYPNGALTYSGSLLYGMTSEGGNIGDGNIFSINLDGSGYRNLYNFTGATGVLPGSSLILSGGVLYGMSYLGGGSNNDGLVFSVNADGTGFKPLNTFTGTNGANPQRALVLSGSTLYGVTSAGAAQNSGNIFSIGTNGTGFKDMYDFNINTGPVGPYCTLIYSGTTLYGTASGGADIGGYIFSINTDGTGFTNLYSFTGASGSFPQDGLLLSNNVLYGVTNGGGKHGYGTIYSFSL